ncbi:MAG TPA: chromate resistance protein ChrB domain-containing protein [Methylococcus sp.]|nr:chromate resistance protein ChrB domain-containing protein [Methylococcus sp.]
MRGSWLVFIIRLPTHNATGRMRVWRALKSLGCGVLRDGVYLLPHRPGFRQALEEQAEEVVQGGGNAHVLVLDSESQDQQKTFESLFDRSDDYAKLAGAVRQAVGEIPSEEPAKLGRKVNRLRKEFETIVALDFFPGAAREQAAAALEELELAVSDRLAPDEPHAVSRRIQRLRREDYQGRLWATRRRPWIDRLASAWLIRRFIDPDARFLWLATPAHCPADALGFDFDGAAFTHVGTRVTFEVLLASFGLTAPPLQRIGAMVHYLDVGGIPAPEAAGLETLLRGMHQRLSDDDELLIEAGKVFDSFYLAFSGNDT